MKRLVLLLPLLLLANSMPTGATQQKTAEVLLRQTIEIQDELKVMLKEAQASGDQCGESYRITAALEMLAAKWGALAAIDEAEGDMKQAIDAQGTADSFRAKATNIRRICR